MGELMVGIECPICDTPFEANIFNLMNGNTKSCGCRRVSACSKTGKTNRTHGLTLSRTYKSWSGMWQRVINPKNPSYARYGARGITIHPEWGNFANFFRDMGLRPKGTSIDRINNNEGYEMNNCRWATAKQQANNRG